MLLWDWKEFLRSICTTSLTIFWSLQNTKFLRRNLSWRIIGQRTVLTMFFKLTHLQSKIVYVCFSTKAMLWSELTWKTGARPWDISPEPIVWTWIGCRTDRIWMLEFISNTSTHLNMYLTFWPKIITADTFGQSHHTVHAHQEPLISLISLVPNSVKMSECLARIMRLCVVQMCVYMCIVFY